MTFFGRSYNRMKLQLGILNFFMKITHRLCHSVVMGVSMHHILPHILYACTGTIAPPGIQRQTFYLCASQVGQVSTLPLLRHPRAYSHVTGPDSRATKTPHKDSQACLCVWPHRTSKWSGFGHQMNGWVGGGGTAHQPDGGTLV